MIKMIAGAMTAIAILVASWAQPASAELNESCKQKWMLTIQLQAAGKKCKLTDAAGLKRLAALEKRHFTCVTAKASPEDKGMFEKTASTQLRKEALAGLKDMQCGKRATGFFKGMSIFVSK